MNAVPPKAAPELSFSERLDDKLRFKDLKWRRTVGGTMETKHGIRGHSPAVIVLPTLLIGLLVLGSPTPARAGISAVVMLVVALALRAQLRFTSRTNGPIGVDFGVQAALVVLLFVGTWYWGGDRYRDVAPYLHLFIPLALAAVMALVLGQLALSQLCKGLASPNGYPVYLTETELFASREPTPKWSAGVALAALAMPLRAPLALLTIPALVTLLSPPAWINYVPPGFFVVCLLLLLLSGVNERFGFMWLLVQRNLLRGGAFVISIFAIALAVARYTGITYVTTIFDSAAWWTITAIFASAYVLAWWFDYWCYRLLTVQVLRMLAPGTLGRDAIPYDITASAKSTSVPLQGRLLQAHGSDRVLAIYESNSTLRFQAYDTLRLIELIAFSGRPGGKAKPSPALARSRATNYLALTMGAFLATVFGVGWHLHEGEQAAETSVVEGQPPLDLKEFLVSEGKKAGDEPLVIVAASGGGTRAAIYTASVLEAVTRAGKGQRVVFVSGVSGGGAALAYFAANRAKLISKDESAWNDFYEAMRKPFIQDVLVRSTEWYMVGEGRLGMLLKDSFEDRWKLPPHHQKLGEISDIGIMLNTSLAGKFTNPYSLNCAESLQAAESEHPSWASSNLAGGRLLLTNLAFSGDLSQTPLEPGANVADLPVLIHSPGVRLEEAAALNANFPPVFSNAAIDVGCKTRYWVTDGGAVDNRGMEMMLFALKQAVSKMAPADRPRLQIVIADASALSDSFSQDRGISSLSGAGTHFASHLNSELYAEIRAAYGDQAEQMVHLTYVMMPDILRQSGSFGTHWMLQDSIRVRHADRTTPEGGEPREDSARIPGEQMIRVLRALQGGPPGSAPRYGDACKVLCWAWNDKLSDPNWSAFQKEYGISAPAACFKY